MTVSGKDWPESPLDAVDTAFAALTCDPHPLTLNLDTLSLDTLSLDTLDPGSLDLGALGDDTGLPDGVIALPVLRTWLLRHPRSYTTRDAVWRELIRRARLDGPAWVIAATAMAMPALRRYAGQLRSGWAGDAQDLDAEILTGFLTALRDRVDLSRPAPYAALCKAAWRAGHELRRRDGAEAVPVDNLEHLTGPRTPRRPFGHPDLLVRRAVELGIIDPSDERPYIDLRLGGRAAEPLAAQLGVEVATLRRRAERI
ncbi:hypothetical protein AB0M20_41250, partial [Actinoplanes sp. NPDC051633]|uniref:hypothetical protein n=1 Tax=Actinoplanes sp. NPDC051633 TaxID=3155670 RepID=UPI003423D742